MGNTGLAWASIARRLDPDGHPLGVSRAETAAGAAGDVMALAWHGFITRSLQVVAYAPADLCTTSRTGIGGDSGVGAEWRQHAARHCAVTVGGARH